MNHTNHSICRRYRDVWIKNTNANRQTDHEKEYVETRRTRRDRPKSAPYQRLKNERTSKCQSFDELETLWWKFFWNNVSQCQKTEKGDPWDFSTSILSQNSKKFKGDPLGIKSEKIPQWRKKMEPFSLARYCMLREKRKTFLIQFPGPTGTFRRHLEIL